jgi:serine protease SohB
MTFILAIALFLSKALIIAAIILIIIAGILALMSKGKQTKTGKIAIKKLNDHYKEIKQDLNAVLLCKKQRKTLKKDSKKKDTTDKAKKRIYVINFDGDIKASGVDALREEITAILAVAHKGEEVIVKLTSPGGVIHGYGLAAAQLDRIKNHSLRLTVCVDKVAASGGYMMACVADTILAAPFAIIGSIGAVIQMPNFNRLLKKHNIDFEQLTAGEFKRTLSVFGENTTQGREKMQDELEQAHELFKTFIKEHRPQVDLNKVATGEHWFGSQAKSLNLVDELTTSDDYIYTCAKNHAVFEIVYSQKKRLIERINAKALSYLQ